MKNFETLIAHRRSIRQFTDEPISADEVRLLLQAPLLAPTSRGSKPCHFIAVENKESLALLAKCKKSGAAFLTEAPLVIVVAADPMKSDVWVEDCAIATTYIQLQAEALGLGSCWIQVRGRQTAEGYDSEEFVRTVLEAPNPLQILSIVAIGHKKESRPAHDTENLNWEEVHIDKF